MNFKLQVRVKLKQALVNEISIFETIIDDWSFSLIEKIRVRQALPTPTPAPSWC